MPESNVARAVNAIGLFVDSDSPPPLHWRRVRRFGASLTWMRGGHHFRELARRGLKVRPTWKGFLKLSLVNVPVCMYPAARSQALSFNQIHKVCSTRIKYDKKCPTCNCSVSNDDLVRGYEFAKDQYVILDAEDFNKVRLDSSKSISIVQFVEEGDIDPLHYHGSHYLVPDGQVALESFATIRKVMKEKGRVALAKVVLSGKEQVMAIRPKDDGFVMSSLYYGDEVRNMSELEELENQPDVNPQEVKLASQLIDSITKPFEPETFEDDYRKQLLEIIKAKAEGKEIVAPPQVETGKVINFMDALKSSLERGQVPSAPAKDEDELPATGTTDKK